MDRGFNIQDDLTPLGVQVNIPPFLKGKEQLDGEELIETRRIAYLWIHVERAMERIKTIIFFDKTMPSSLTEVNEHMFLLVQHLQIFFHHYVLKTNNIYSIREGLRDGCRISGSM